jgi:hypothetical protein
LKKLLSLIIWKQKNALGLEYILNIIIYKY